MEKEIEEILNKLKGAGYEAAIVGGAVRDILAKKRVSDWDITTNARPEDILKLFKDDSFYNNRFGTVGIKVRGQSAKETERQRDRERYCCGGGYYL